MRRRQFMTLIGGAAALCVRYLDGENLSLQLVALLSARPQRPSCRKQNRQDEAYDSALRSSRYSRHNAAIFHLGRSLQPALDIEQHPRLVRMTMDRLEHQHAAAWDSRMSDGHYNVLFLSNRNTARSIFAGAVANRLGQDHFTGFSAGNRPLHRALECMSHC